MVNRAFKRALRRLRGDHPRRKSHPARFGIYVLCDLMLVVSGLAFLAGVARLLWTFVHGVSVMGLGLGLGLIVLSAVLLLLWEKVFWEPVAHTLEHLS